VSIVTWSEKRLGLARRPQATTLENCLMKIGIFGAGIAGLGAAHFLREHFGDIQIHEASKVIGGLARSFKWHGFDCDLAPHRLFTNDEPLLQELLALVPMEQIRRRSRIFLRGKWIQDPVNAIEMVLKFLPAKSFSIVWHYLFRKKYPEDNFESMILGRFGKGLNPLFFKPYSEKLFGIPADQISAAWGRKKIRMGGLRDMLRRNSKLYFRHFYYPRANGYGSICQRLYEGVQDSVYLQSRLTGIRPVDDNKRYECEFLRQGQRCVETFDVVVTTLPVSLFAGLLGLNLTLRFRPARITYLLVKRSRVTDNHWFYFADKEYILNRVAEFKNFANNGLPAEQTVLCCEVTQVERFSLERVVAELAGTGLLHPSEILDTKTIDIDHAYPIYDRAFEDQMKMADQFFARHPRIHHVGRHAQFAHRDVDEIFDEAKKAAARICREHSGAALPV
jgi:protoporphyrinogen oxidase